MGHNNEALADLERAIELEPGLDWAIASQGQICNSIVTRESD
jgi:hypothetical protein